MTITLDSEDTKNQGDEGNPTKGVYKYKLFVDISSGGDEYRFAINELGFTEPEWDALTEEMRVKELKEFLHDWISGRVDYGWSAQD
jgi:hypothetical protein